MLCICQTGKAQSSSGADPTSAAFQTGTREFGSYHGGNIDTINLETGSLMIDIPVISYPQRGKLALNFVLHYQELSWFDMQSCGGTGGGSQGNPGGGSTEGAPPVCFTIGPPGYEHGFQLIETGASLGPGPVVFNSPGPNLSAVGLTGPHCTETNPPSGGNQYFCNPLVVEADGASHPLVPISPTTYWAADGTGFRMDFSLSQILAKSPGAAVVVTNPDGIRHIYPTGSSSLVASVTEDPNGNQITLSEPNGSGLNFSYTDTLGRTIPLNSGTSSDSSGCTGPLPISRVSVWSPPGPEGGTYTVKFCYAGVPETVPASPGPLYPQSYTASALQSLVLPNGQAWTFQYTTDRKGELSQITFPTGGTISYTWGPGPIEPLGLAGLTTFPRAVVSRTLNPQDGDPVETWEYTYDGLTENINATSMTNVVTDPVLNDTTHTFAISPLVRLNQEVKTQYFQGSASSGTLLKTVQYAYQPTTVPKADNLSVPFPILVPTQVTTTWANGQTAQVNSTYDSGFSISCFIVGLFDQNGNPINNNNCSGTAGTAIYGKVLSKTETDYGSIGSNSPGPPLRTTTTNFEFLVNPAYLNNNLLTLPASVAISDGSGNMAALTTYGYDETSVNPSGVSVQLDSNPPAGSVRGNVTSVNRWLLNTTGGPVTTKTSWLDSGEVFQNIDALSNANTYSYSSNYAGAYVTQSCNALKQCASRTYDFNTGLITSSTDVNGQITQYAYDPVERIQQVIWPAQVVDGRAIAGQSTFTYNDSPGSVSIQRTDQQDASTSVTSFRFFDGFGRPNGTQLNDPSGNILTKTTYDAMGRVNTVTNPFRSMKDTTYGVTQTQYDAFGRPTSVTRPDGSVVSKSYAPRTVQEADEGNGSGNLTRISQSDALGRLISVCEVINAMQAGQNAPAACNQDIVRSGFLTSYQYDALGNLTQVQQGALRRSFQYDSLSRLLGATNPESGTASYQYDLNGNLIARIRPAPNQPGSATVTTTYGYDSLNRPTSITYSDGITPSVTKKYDSTSELGVALNNTIGRLSAEYVTNASGQLLSGRVYSYDPMGRVVDNSQCVPSTCSSSTSSLSSITYSYNLLGKPLTTTNGQGVSFAYAYDTAGRLTSMSSSLSDSLHPATLFSGAFYSALGGLTGATFGSVLNEAMAYNCRGWIVSYGSAVAPVTATAPSVPTPGCPVAVAAGTNRGSSGELFANLFGTGFGLGRSGISSIGMDDLWGVPTITLGAVRGAPSNEGTAKLFARANSILVSRSNKRSKVERGSLKITLTLAKISLHPETVSVRYGSADEPAMIALRLAREINRRYGSILAAKVVRKRGTVRLDLIDRGSRNNGFFAFATVHSNQELPSVTATVINGRQTVVVRSVPAFWQGGGQ